jgi:hypothetical protein
MYIIDFLNGKYFLKKDNIVDKILPVYLK